MKTLKSNTKTKLIVIFISIFSLALGNLSATAPSVNPNNVQQVSLSNSKKLKMESMLSSKKWIVTNVKRKKLTKMEKFRLDTGNELSFTIDKKFGFKNNQYEYASGKWLIDGNKLIIMHTVADGDKNVIVSKTFKIVRLKEDQLILKSLDKPRGKFVLR